MSAMLGTPSCPSAITGYVHSAVLLLGQHLRRRATVEPASPVGVDLYWQCETQTRDSKYETLTQCWFNVGPVSLTLAQH